MRLPELLVVGVVPPKWPYPALPYPLPLLLGVVPPDEETVPVPLVVLPQAVKRTIHVTKTSRLNQPRILVCVVERVLRITFSSFPCGDIASGDSGNENELCNDLLFYTDRSYKEDFQNWQGADSESYRSGCRSVLSQQLPTCVFMHLTYCVL
jgi:hypothetical protein